MSKSPREKCLINPRVFIKKGWGIQLKQAPTPPFINNKGEDRKEEDLVGEVFVYHADKNPTPFNHTYFRHEPELGVKTVKVLYIAKDKKVSLHFHIKKREIFFLIKGSLEVVLISDGIKETFPLNEGDTLFIAPGMIHQMKGLEEENILLEVSSKDMASDSYRVEKGD